MYVSGPRTYSLGQKVKRQGDRSQWPENLVNTISHNQKREFYPILVTDVYGFMVLISFWDQKINVKVTAGNNPKKRMNTMRVSSQIFSPKLGHIIIKLCTAAPETYWLGQRTETWSSTAARRVPSSLWLLYRDFHIIYHNENLKWPSFGHFE